MSEFRQDPLTGAWVIVAPERGRRPRLASGRVGAPSGRPAFDPSCPFCPGNEHMLPGILEETAAPDPPGWRTRVVPNKYPALAPRAAVSVAGGARACRPGHGHHEVVIETPRHDAEPATLGPAEMAAVLAACRRRHAHLIMQPGIEAVLVFRNRGEHGGASLAHPHAQVIAIGIVPPHLAATATWARQHHERHGHCVTCATLTHETAAAGRIVEVSDGFVALVPFAAEAPFEQRILPRRHQAAFDEASETELAELAGILQRSLRRLGAVLDDPAYNYVIESGTRSEVGAPHAHWRLRILPHRTRPGGFELGTGMPINPSLPERDAEALRAVVLPEGRSWV